MCKKIIVVVTVLVLAVIGHAQEAPTEEECGGSVDPTSYVLLKNPGYPTTQNQGSTYPSSTDCEWWFDGDENTLILCKFWDMVIEIGENNSNETCDFDYVNITITSIGSRRYCGYSVPEETIRGLGSLKFIFHSDASVNYRGFQATCSIMGDYDPCDPHPCGNGDCGRTEDRLDHLCHCFAGVTGEYCQIDISECESDPCQNGGTCTEPELNEYKCHCVRGWEGKDCQTEITSPCSVNPCFNDGTCTVIEVIEYTCTCGNKFRGSNCEIEKGCLNPGIPYIEEDKLFDEGSTVEFTCVEGFLLTGEVNLTCGIDGSWSYDMPECVSNTTYWTIIEEREGVSPFLKAMICLGVALGINLVVFALWMIYRCPWLNMTPSPVTSPPSVSDSSSMSVDMF